MHVSVLIENGLADCCHDLQAESGLSLLIEHEGRHILFDTGASGAFADNAEKLGIDLSRVDAAVLSHHHFDHGGGLARFLELNDLAPIYLRRCDDRGHTFRALGVLKRPVGIDYGLIEQHPERFREISNLEEILPGVFVLTELARNHPRPKGNRHIFVERAGSLVEDPFDHELVMVVRDAAGLVVFSGCSHSGILNMVDTASVCFPGQPVRAVFGGFHLIGIPLFNSMSASRPEVEAIGRQMLEHVNGTVYSGHCTGTKAYSVLAGVMGDSLKPISTGTVLEV